MQAARGLRWRACQAPKALANPRRVALPSAVRDPPLILRMMTRGRSALGGTVVGTDLRGADKGEVLILMAQQTLGQGAAGTRAPGIAQPQTLQAGIEQTRQRLPLRRCQRGGPGQFGAVRPLGVGGLAEAGIVLGLVQHGGELDGLLCPLRQPTRLPHRLCCATTHSHSRRSSIRAPLPQRHSFTLPPLLLSHCAGWLAHPLAHRHPDHPQEAA